MSLSTPRVLFVVAYLRGNDGITSHMMDLAEGLMASGWSVAIASCMNDDAAHTVRGPSWFESRGIRHFSVPFPDGRRPDNEPADVLRAWPAFRRVLSEFQPDVLHLHSLSLAPYAWLQRATGGVPYVTTCHIQPHADRLKIRLGAQVNRFLPTFLGNRSIAVGSELWTSLHEELHVPADQIDTIPYGIDASRFRPPSGEERAAARAAFSLDPGTFAVSVIGRLNPVKRQDVLIEAVARLREQGVPATALVAGSGDWEPYLRDQIDRLDAHDYVQMLGFTDAQQVVWASDATALPSSWESFGIVVPEAMLCEVVPVRTPAAGATDQIDDGETGFIVPFDDPEAMAQRLRVLAENPEQRAAMGRAARQAVLSRFTAEIMTGNVIRCYRAALGASTEPASQAHAVPA